MSLMHSKGEPLSSYKEVMIYLFETYISANIIAKNDAYMNHHIKQPSKKPPAGKRNYCTSRYIYV